jgi:hypothetical protein
MDGTINLHACLQFPSTLLKMIIKGTMVRDFRLAVFIKYFLLFHWPIIKQRPVFFLENFVSKI